MKFVDVTSFSWGRVVQTHYIGEYAVVEYAPFSDDAERRWHPYIDGRDTNHSYPSLDAALVGCIARRHDGCNTRADRYFLRAIGAE